MGLGGAPERPGQEPEGEGPCQGGGQGHKGCALRSRSVLPGGVWREGLGRNGGGMGWSPIPCPTGPILKGEAEGETAPPKALTVSGPPAPGAGVDGKGA